MSRYRLQWQPQGSIPQDVNLRVKLPDVVEPGEEPAPEEACEPCCRSYVVTDSFGIIADPALPNVWLYPCAGSASFGMSVSADVELCGRTDYAWTLNTEHFTVGGVVIDSFDVDDEGRPRVMLSGSTPDCTGTTNEALLWLTLGGEVFCFPIHIRPGCASLPFYSEYDTLGPALGGSSVFPFALTMNPACEVCGFAIQVSGLCEGDVVEWATAGCLDNVGAVSTTTWPDDTLSVGWNALSCPCDFTVEATVNGNSVGVINVSCEPV